MRKIANSPNKDYERLKDMPIHSIVEVTKSVDVMRVHGGWVYFLCVTDPVNGNAGAVTSTFVPEK